MPDTINIAERSKSIFSFTVLRKQYAIGRIKFRQQIKQDLVVFIIQLPNFFSSQNLLILKVINATKYYLLILRKY
jgi:hypothetical protein